MYAHFNDIFKIVIVELTDAPLSAMLGADLILTERTSSDCMYYSYIRSVFS